MILIIATLGGAVYASSIAKGFVGICYLISIIL